MKRILSVLLAVLILCSVFVMPASAETSDTPSGKYVDKFESYLIERGSSIDEGFYYEELYEYYADSKTLSTPDFILVRGGTYYAAPGTASGVFGEYYIFEGWYHFPYPLGYYVYIPEKDNFYTLEFVWMENFEGIENLFTEYLIKEGIATYVEDVDSDGKITKTDADAMEQGINHFNSFETRPYIFFDANAVGWDNFEKVYCGVTENDGSPLYNEQSRASLCTDFDGDGIWKYDLYNLSYSLEYNTPWSINFHNENGDVTSQLNMTKANIGSTVYCTGELDENHNPIIKWQDDTIIQAQTSVKEAISKYEQETGEKFETNRYYFLMPDGTKGIKCNDTECLKGEHYAESWYNEYTDQPAIYWWKTDVAKPDKFPGYTVEKGDADSVFYADVPKAVTEIVWSNNIEFTYGADDPAKDFGIQTINLPCEYYDAGESPNYPDGTESFDNMIYVIYPDTIGTGEMIVGNPPVGGEWYYYYGDGCYGIVKDGKTADCIRDDHDHSDRFLHFDANSTNWRYYEKVYCHIWEVGGDPFYDWQKKAERCTDNDGDGIWTYDLVEHNIELDESKQYAVIFSNELGRQTYNLIFDKTVLGDTAYVGEILGPDHENARTEIAYWRNQDKTEYGPELRINTIGEVQGTCVPKSTTAYDLFKGFLVTYLENAQIYSGKTDQALLDDLAKELKISADDVERAIKETGVDVEWKHPDKLSVKEAVERYEEKTGKKVDTIRYYFLMPNGNNGQLRTDDVDGNPFAPSWYNTYANKPGVYWWDVAGDLDPPRFPGYYFEESDSQDVYYVDIPKEVTTVLWNNYIFESMDTADDPMRAYSRYTDEAILPHQIYSFIPGEQPNGWIYVVDPDSEWIFDNGKQTYSGKWYFYYGDGCYGETSDGECIRGDHDHRVYDTYIVAGVEKLCGSSWDVYDINNKMTYNEETGAYEITYTNVPVGNHEFMVTKNFEFGPLTPGNPDYNEAKVTVDGSTVKITYTEGVGVDVTVTPPLLGDVDLDGVVSIMDATEIQLAVAKKKTLTQEQEKLADTDFDGEISIIDATAIQLFVAKKITEFK